MKKSLRTILLIISLAVSVISHVHAGGGDSFAGGLAGGVTGGLISGAITSGGVSKAERETIKARQEAELLRHEREKMTINEMRRELEHKEALGSLNGGGAPIKGSMLYLLMFFILVLIVGIGVMALLLFKRPRLKQ